MPTSINKAFPSKYLKAHDLPNDQTRVPVEIDGFHWARFSDANDPDQERPVLTFKGKKKGLVLNKTNASMIAAKYGDDMEKWGGCEISLYADVTPFRDKIVPCVRVTTEVTPPKPPAEPLLPGDGDSDLPF